MSTIGSIPSAISELAAHGVAYAPQIARAAAQHGLDPRLLAAVAAQETGGPGANGGRNILGDGGHGHGLFQIDDRWHPFARTGAAMNAGRNADYAAGMLSGLLARYGGNVHRALSAYNAGSPTACGTVTTWQDGAKLGYADSVMRHYADLGGSAVHEELQAESPSEQASVNSLRAFSLQFPGLCPASMPPQSNARPAPEPDFASIVNDSSNQNSGG
ncbi:MAG TPA: transglycosylase SLT domain-containing protein [Candidatus Baltobacteraceae bacterium]